MVKQFYSGNEVSKIYSGADKALKQVVQSRATPFYHLARKTRFGKDELNNLSTGIIKKQAEL